MPEICRYKKTQLIHGSAYILEPFFEDARKTSMPHRSFQLCDVVISRDGNIVKSRYHIDDVFENYLIVNSSPMLRQLVAIYNKVFNVISKG